MSILIKGAKVLQLCPESIAPPTDILIEGDHIDKVGVGLQGARADRVIDAVGRYVMPGNVCAHNHFYSALARGITAEIKPSYDFVGVLENLWWRLDRALDESSLYHSGLVGALDAVRAGTTAVVDHNASPSYIRGSLKVLKEAFGKCGLRGILCYEVTDRNGLEGRDTGIEENVEFIEGQETDMVKGAVGAHAPFTLGDDSLERLSEAVHSTGRGLHTHLSEDRYDLSHSHHLYGMSPAERLVKFKLLDEKSLIIHGVHMLDKEAEILEDRGSFLVHNPRSNMNNAVGYCRALARITNIALGTDGIGSDMFEELKFAYFKSRDAGTGLIPSDFTRSLQGGNLILERYFGDEAARKSSRKLGPKFGRIEPGYAADIVLVDYMSPTPVVAGNIAGHFVFGMSSQAVETVIIGGRCVYEGRRFPFDVEPIYREARKEAARLWKAMERF